MRGNYRRAFWVDRAHKPVGGSVWGNSISFGVAPRISQKERLSRNRKNFSEIEDVNFKLSLLASKLINFIKSHKC
jgi:hypothetical protein